MTKSPAGPEDRQHRPERWRRATASRRCEPVFQTTDAEFARLVQSTKGQVGEWNPRQPQRNECQAPAEALDQAAAQEITCDHGQPAAYHEHRECSRSFAALEMVGNERIGDRYAPRFSNADPGTQQEKRAETTCRPAKCHHDAPECRRHAKQS